jgi:hypothetical protein
MYTNAVNYLKIVEYSRIFYGMLPLQIYSRMRSLYCRHQYVMFAQELGDH